MFLFLFFDFSAVFSLTGSDGKLDFTSGISEGTQGATTASMESSHRWRWWTGGSVKAGGDGLILLLFYKKPESFFFFTEEVRRQKVTVYNDPWQHM